MKEKKIKQPVFDKSFHDRYLSIDGYIEFVNFTSEHFHKNRISRERELAMRVNVPFRLD